MSRLAKSLAEVCEAVRRVRREGQLDRPDDPPVRWLMKNLIIVGDPFHPPETQAPSLTAIMASIGIKSDVEEDVEAGCRKLASGKYRLLTFSAARWRMLNATSGPVDPEAIPPPSDPDPRWAVSLSESGREAIRQHLRGGGSLLAMHSAAIAFDDWPEWGEIVGARWVWGQSGHPTLGPVEARFTPGHPRVRWWPICRHSNARTRRMAGCGLRLT